VKLSKFFLFLIFLLIFFNLMAIVNSVNVVDVDKYNEFENYEFVSKIKVDCSEYIGVVEFPAPSEFNASTDGVFFDGGDIFYREAHDSINYLKYIDWYVSDINGVGVSSAEKVFDNDYNSYLILENKDTINSKLTFSNPNSLSVDSILFEIKDSKIDSFSISKKGSSKKIPFTLNKNAFSYEINFNESYLFSDLEIILGFSGILKIREVSFFQKVRQASDAEFYFNLNNQCDKTFSLYFGKFSNSQNLKSYDFLVGLPKSFYVNVNTKKNGFYISDFDLDEVSNELDNCPYVENFDQKDINFNKRGDACEDFDNDGILNAIDNCPQISNVNQYDMDLDGIGNLCDEKDDRFFSKYGVAGYILIIIVLALFIFLTLKIFKHKENNIELDFKNDFKNGSLNKNLDKDNKKVNLEKKIISKKDSKEIVEDSLKKNKIKDNTENLDEEKTLKSKSDIKKKKKLEKKKRDRIRLKHIESHKTRREEYEEDLELKNSKFNDRF